MGKSSSCFRLITCGGGDDSADKHDYQLVSENKDSNDKRGWSFRKRSARHRVLSNTVITETSSAANKESTECASINVQPPANVVEKIYTPNFSDEKPQLSTLASSQMSETVVTNTESKADINLPEDDVIIIQAVIRGFLARRALLKSKNVVKLQAAVRGHLVRRHAVGTLRCVQAIAKMQVLVRARRAQQLHSENHLNRKGNENQVTKSNGTYTSVEKLLSNKFARQLLESTPKKKPIHVKCDPSKTDSAWKWLERWMSVSSRDSVECKKPICISEQSAGLKDGTSVSQLEGVLSEVFLQSTDSKPSIGDLALNSKDEEMIATNDANSFDFQASPSTSSLVEDNLEQPSPEKTITDDAEGTSTANDYFQNQEMELEGIALEEPSSVPPKPEIDSEQGKLSTEKLASDQLEMEGKEFVHGTRKFSNPAFLAAQSKFEELSSIANSGKSGSLSNQDAPVDSQAGTSSVATDAANRSKEFISSENSVAYPSRTGGSECGTELSISSTLDSPDRSEVGVVEIGRDPKDLAEGIGNPENKIDYGVQANIRCAASASNLPNSDLDQLEIVDHNNGDMVHSAEAGDSKDPAVDSEKNASALSREHTETVCQDFKLSPEASPRSHATIPESQGTPSSQVSIKPKESKVNKHGSSNKRRILSGGNKSPANANHDSGGSRGSREHLPKDQSSGKRRNSFGSVKHDQVDQEPGDNGSNNSSLPHFMQATESARAKINANNSPRSSPDVHDQEDIHVKKRHSLPGATGRQGSPRIQRTSQAQQSTKGNVLHALHEKKWQR